MDSASKNDPKPSSKPLGSLGRDEMNLAEFPIALLTDRVPKDQTAAVYQDEIYDERTGRTLTRKLTITAGNHGLTTPVDDDIILALIQLTRLKNNFTNRRVEFTRHELIQLLGWSVGGAKYERIEVALDRWTSVHLKYENAWRDNRTKTWTSKEAFHIIDKYEFNDMRMNGEQLDLIPSYIVWGEDIFESFQAGYLKPLDYDLCMGLRNSTAKRMYRFLDKRFHHKPDWTFDLKEFAHGHIGLGYHYEGPSHLKRNLEPAITELETVGFLEPLSPNDRFPKEGKCWKVRLIQKAASVLAFPAPVINAEPAPPALVTALTKRGVSDKTAAELVQKYPAEFIQLQLEVFDWLVAKQDKKVAKSPAGYLVSSILEKYREPTHFVSEADRKRQEEARKAKERQDAEDRRRKQQEEADERAEQQRINAYRTALTPETLAQHEADAIAQASEEIRQSLDTPAMALFRKTLLHRLTDDYIRQLLNSQATVPVE